MGSILTFLSEKKRHINCLLSASIGHDNKSGISLVMHLCLQNMRMFWNPPDQLLSNNKSSTGPVGHLCSQNADFWIIIDQRCQPQCYIGSEQNKLVQVLSRTHLCAGPSLDAYAQESRPINWRCNDLYEHQKAVSVGHSDRVTLCEYNRLVITLLHYRHYCTDLPLTQDTTNAYQEIS